MVVRAHAVLENDGREIADSGRGEESIFERGIPFFGRGFGLVARRQVDSIKNWHLEGVRRNLRPVGHNEQ